MPPEAPPCAVALERALSRLLTRIRAAHVLFAVAAGIALATLLRASGGAVVADWTGAAAVSVVMVATRRSRTRRQAAVLLERAAPGSRNTLITAEELLAHPERASARMRARVFGDAARLAAGVRLSAARPLRGPAMTVLAAIITAVGLTGIPHRFAGSVLDVARGASMNRSGAVSLTVTVEPPAYTRRPATREVNPEHIEALAGSTARLSIDADPREWRLRFGRHPVEWSASGTAAVPLDESGYFALAPIASTAAARLVPVTVSPDGSPVVRIETPARDLVVPDATRTIRVKATASDDLALESLELRYTKVSGTGEDFEFVEGRLPIALVRASDQKWDGTAGVALGSLQLEPGDSLVYRAVAKDRRPGAQGEASSDTFFIEVAGPGQIGLEGFELPPEQERYALSQQMVVLKIERLRAREASMAHGSVQGSAAAIAADQRAVRAYFIFLMGGHVEDEEMEAEQSNEIQEGRLENTARREISAAVHLMTRVEQGLMASSTAAALPPAKSAVETLQRAFGRNRYILRTPPSRAGIDPSRRLSGRLASAASWRRDVQRPGPDARLARIDAFVSASLAVAKRISSGEPAAAPWFASLAEQALAIEPGAREWQQSAARLTALGEAAAAARSRSEWLAQLSDAVKPALDAAQSASRAHIGRPRSTALGRAWAEESKR